MDTLHEEKSSSRFIFIRIYDLQATGCQKWSYNKLYVRLSQEYVY